MCVHGKVPSHQIFFMKIYLWYPEFQIYLTRERNENKCNLFITLHSSSLLHWCCYGQHGKGDLLKSYTVITILLFNYSPHFLVFSLSGSSLMLLHSMDDQCFVQEHIVSSAHKSRLLELPARGSLETV